MKTLFIFQLLFLILTSCFNAQPEENLQKEEAATKIAKHSTLIAGHKTYDEYIKAGEHNLQNSRPYEAIKQFEQATKIDDKRVEGYYGLGVAKAMICFNEQRLCDDAITELNKAININPRYRNPFFNLSICKTQKEDYIGALEALDKAIQQYPDDPDCYHNRGSIKLILGDTVTACNDFHTSRKKGSEIAQQKILLYCQ